MSDPSPAENRETLAAIAREHEPDRHLAAVFSSENLRGPQLALAAYCAELRRIPQLVREPMMGEIRLQWWRDALARAAGDARAGHPVADALADVIRRFGLPTGLLVAMTEARAFDLYDDPMPDRASLDGYLAKLECAPFELAYRVACGGNAPAGADFRTLQAAGKAYGLARWMLEAPDALSRGRDPLPAALIEPSDRAHDAGAHDRIASVRRVADALLAEAASALGEARQDAAGWEGEKRNVLLPLAMVPTYLAKARRMIAEGFDRRRDPLPLSRVVRIGWSRWRGRL